MNVRSVINEIHQRVELESQHAARSGHTPPDSGLLLARSAYGRLYEIRNLVGQMPASPDTTRARVGAFLVRLIQRMLFWYTPQILRFNNQTTQVLGALCEVASRQAETIEELRSELTLLRCEVASPNPAETAGSQPATVQRSKSSAFEFSLQDHFRGSETDTFEKQSHWLDAVIGAERSGGRDGVWLDIGCGRGEWLSLAAAPSREVIGIDLSPISIEHCRSKNLTVVQRDAVEHLSSLPDGALAVITAFQVIEHLPMDYLKSVVALAARKLRPGGVLVIETPDPSNLVMASHHFWNDPTHQKPIPSALMEFMFGYFGLNVVRKLHLNPFPENERLTYTEIEPVRRVDDLLHGPRDYGLIGRREA